MNREIKFRAMNYVSHTWWYGSNQVDRIDYGTNTMPIRTFWRWFAENALDPKTLGQYTGLKAKEVEVYEGDVIEHGDYVTDAHTCLTYCTVVEYFPTEGSYNICLPTERGDYIKVIGSIYENEEDLNEGRRQTKQRTSTARGG